MSQFDYTLPSGAKFRVNAPAGTTQLQADSVFYEQVAAGSFVGFQPGQTLRSAESRLAKFELSRLDRGTAGVDTAAVLSVLQNLPVIADIPDLVDVPLQDPVTAIDIALNRGDSLGPSTIGPLTSFQVQALQAQLAKQVDQDSDVITKGKGIGKYGLNCLQLEQAGYVKPGTFAKFLADNPDDFVSVMNSPGIWTGLGGVNNLQDLLLDANTQNQVQTQLMQISYDSLSFAGVINNVSQPTISVSQGQIYTASGLAPINLLNSLGPVSTDLGTIASGALSNAALAQTTVNIKNRITGELGTLVNNGGKFGSLATAAWAKSGGIPSAASLLSNLPTVPNLSNLNVNSLTSGLTNLVPGNLGNLKAGLDTLGKASQFSMNLTNPLASISNINVQGLASGALGNAQGLAANALGGIQGQISGQLGRLGNLFASGGDLVSGTQIAAGFNNTVNRKTLDSAVTRIIGNAKIPTPSFEFPSPASVAEKLDITQAQNIVNGLRGQGQALLNQATGAVNRTRSLVTTAQNTFNRLTG